MAGRSIRSVGAPVDLLERDEELAALQAALEAARAGTGKTWVLEGPREPAVAPARRRRA